MSNNQQIDDYDKYKDCDCVEPHQLKEYFDKHQKQEQILFVEGNVKVDKEFFQFPNTKEKVVAYEDSQQPYQQFKTFVLQSESKSKPSQQLRVYNFNHKVKILQTVFRILNKSKSENIKALAEKQRVCVLGNVLKQIQEKSFTKEEIFFIVEPLYCGERRTDILSKLQQDKNKRLEEEKKEKKIQKQQRKDQEKKENDQQKQLRKQEKQKTKDQEKVQQSKNQGPSFFGLVMFAAIVIVFFLTLFGPKK